MEDENGKLKWFSVFVQAAGFLKVNAGDNPFDSTWIHPESYAVAEKLLQTLGASIEDLSEQLKASSPVTAQPVAQPQPTVDPPSSAEAEEATGNDS